MRNINLIVITSAVEASVQSLDSGFGLKLCVVLVLVYKSFNIGEINSKSIGKKCKKNYIGLCLQRNST